MHAALARCGTVEWGGWWVGDPPWGGTAAARLLLLLHPCRPPRLTAAALPLPTAAACCRPLPLAAPRAGTEYDVLELGVLSPKPVEVGGWQSGCPLAALKPPLRSQGHSCCCRQLPAVFLFTLPARAAPPAARWMRCMLGRWATWQLPSSRWVGGAAAWYMQGAPRCVARVCDCWRRACHAWTTCRLSHQACGQHAGAQPAAGAAGMWQGSVSCTGAHPSAAGKHALDAVSAPASGPCVRACRRWRTRAWVTPSRSRSSQQRRRCLGTQRCSQWCSAACSPRVGGVGRGRAGRDGTGRGNGWEPAWCSVQSRRVPFACSSADTCGPGRAGGRRAGRACALAKRRSSSPVVGRCCAHADQHAPLHVLYCPHACMPGHPTACAALRRPCSRRR